MDSFDKNERGTDQARTSKTPSSTFLRAHRLQSLTKHQTPLIAVAKPKMMKVRITMGTSPLGSRPPGRLWLVRMIRRTDWRRPKLRGEMKVIDMTNWKKLRMPMKARPRAECLRIRSKAWNREIRKALEVRVRRWWRVWVCWLRSSGWREWVVGNEVKGSSLVGDLWLRRLVLT